VERLQQRVREARANVDAAMGSATDELTVTGQLGHAAADWRHEAGRIERELVVTQRLTGEPRKQAMAILKGRVDELQRVADKIVDTAFTETLLPSSPELDRLRHADERLDALERARLEVEALHAVAPTRLRSVRVLRVTRLVTQIPGLTKR